MYIYSININYEVYKIYNGKSTKKIEKGHITNLFFNQVIFSYSINKKQNLTI